jgi:Mg2+ and Co2+ transporter CorA
MSAILSERISNDLFGRVQGLEFTLRDPGTNGRIFETSSKSLRSAQEVDGFLKKTSGIQLSTSAEPSSSAQPSSDTPSSSSSAHCRIVSVNVNKDKEPFPRIRDQLLLPDNPLRKTMVRGTGVISQDPYGGKAAGSLGEGQILLQSPPQSTGPYLLFFLDVHDEVNNGVYVYDTGDKDDRRSSNFDIASRFSFNTKELKLLSEDDRFRKSDNDPEKWRAVVFIMARLAYNIVKAYLAWLQDTFQKIHKELDGIQKQINQKSSKDVSTPAERLDKLTMNVQELDLDHCSDFSSKSIQWLRTSLPHGAIEPDTQKLLDEEEGFDGRPRRVHERTKEIRTQLKRKLQENLLNKTQLLNDKLALLQLDIADEGLNLTRATGKDSRSMRAIAVITMAFLPATFVASFFGMNFFNGIPGWPGFDRASRFVWMYFLISVPITGFVLGLFFRWEYKEKQKENQRETMQEGQSESSLSSAGREPAQASPTASVEFGLATRRTDRSYQASQTS